MTQPNGSESGPPDAERVADLVQSLATVMCQSSITELDLDVGDVSVRLRRPAPDHDGGEMRLDNQPLASREPDPPEILITAPMIGTFYAAATPGVQPFVVEGDAGEIAGKRVLAIEDGPTLTHGEMTYGAAVLAAKANGAAELIDPREAAVGSIAKTFEDYPHVGALLPAMGYGRKQMEDLKATIEASGAELVLIGTPIDLRKLIDFDVPALRVTYKLQEVGEPTLADVLREHGLIGDKALV